ncbi:MAG: ABC transporter permease, partial [Clostridia bacterium]|nr:ABC transporter permease [Clostridia bacterium]
YVQSFDLDVYATDPALLTDAFKSVPTSRTEADGKMFVPVQVLYLEDAAFRNLCRASGVDPEPYFDSENPNGVLMNSDITHTVYSSNGSKRYRFDLFRSDALPAAVSTQKIRIRDGFVWQYDSDSETSETRIAYYPEGYWHAVMDAQNEYSRTLDIAMADAVLPIEEATETVTYTADAFVKTDDFCIPTENASILYPFSRLDPAVLNGETQAQLYFQTTEHKELREALLKLFSESEFRYNAYAGDLAEGREQSRMIVGVVNVFAYGFIILISLIAATNVFNTISTNIMLRRREFAMLKSIGMTEKGMRRMLSYECIIYGLRALLFGLPVSLGVTFLIHRIVAQELQRGFYVPWHSIAIAVGSVFAVVFATMLYARHRLSRDNPIDALKNENL